MIVVLRAAWTACAKKQIELQAPRYRCGEARVEFFTTSADDFFSSATTSTYYSLVFLELFARQNIHLLAMVLSPDSQVVQVLVRCLVRLHSWGVPVDQLGRERVAPTISSTPANQPVAKSSTLGSSLVHVIWMRHLPLAMRPPKAPCPCFFNNFHCRHQCCCCCLHGSKMACCCHCEGGTVVCCCLCPPVPVELCEEREVSVTIRRAAAMISPPMLA